jgi:DMSO/TMAO reductase YedYZ molybdopterin-dependent catalytic subunit
LIVVGSLIGGWFSSRLAPKRAGSVLVGRALLLGVALWLLEELVILPLFGVGFFGSGAREGGALGPAIRLIGYLVYGAALAAALTLIRSIEARPAGAAPEAPESARRRTLVRVGVFSVLGLVAAGALVRALSGVRETGAVSRVLGRSGDRLPPPITPVADFYSVSKNFIDPVVDRRTWNLEVTGLVRERQVLTIDDLRQLPQHEQLATLSCISNEIGGDLISNGQWRGVRLGELLSRAGVGSGAVDVVFTCADDYTDSISLAKAMEPGTLLALDMNGEPLNDKHGAPLRCVVPNIYGMKNAKWIRKIEVVDRDYQGFWQKQGWSDLAVTRTMSRIDFPRSGSEIPMAMASFGGIAFAGSRGIRAVELSFDDGVSWQPAKLEDVIAPLSWRFWTIDWQPTKPGAVGVLVRATDGKGQLQPAAHADPFPDGASGYHRIFLRVA